VGRMPERTRFVAVKSVEPRRKSQFKVESLKLRAHS
jgi:hypothetical protein